MTDVTDEMVAAAAKVADEQIVPYDAWWDLTPEELARDMLKAALAMNSDDEAARGSRKATTREVEQDTDDAH